MTVSLLAAAYLATCTIDWPALPLGARLPDLLFVPFAIALLRGGRIPLKGLRSLDVLVALYLAGGLPSLLATTDMHLSAIELGRHFYLAFVYMAVAAVAVGGGQLVVSSSLAGGILALSAIGVVAAAAHALAGVDAPLLGETMVVPYFGRWFRIRALTASPNMLACALTVAIPLTLARVLYGGNERRGTTRWWLTGLVAGTVAAVLSVSHAVTGILLGMLIVVWPALVGRAALRALAAVAVTGAILLANGTLVATIRSVGAGSITVRDADRYHHAVDGGEWQFGKVRLEYELLAYFRLKQIASEAVLGNPWTGVGLDRFSTLTERAFEEGRLPSMYRAADPHSALLGRLAETGLAGGITLVALWGGVLALSFAQLRRPEQSWLARAVTASLIGLAVTAINVDIMNFRFVWAVFGLLRGLSHEGA